MAVHEHIEALKTKHATLDEELLGEMQRPHPDENRIAQLKRQKLHIKDEINRLETPAAS